jgi:Flp pilus assembly protein TadB
MPSRLAGVLALSVVIGVVVALVAGAAAGTGAFAAAGVIGPIVLVLWRNHRDRRELERALVPVPIRRVVRDDAPMRERR